MFKMIDPNFNAVAISVNNPYLIHYRGFKILRSTHPRVRKIKRTQQQHSAHGNKVWRSSFVLLDYFSTYPPKTNSKVLDIGCGWGLVGLFLAKNYGAQVTGVDIDISVKPYLELQGEINQCEIDFQQRSFESIRAAELADYQYMIGTDICFWDELTTPLFNLIKRTRRAGVEKILIADPGRPPFWDLADRCATQFQSEVTSKKISYPWKTEKHILVI